MRPVTPPTAGLWKHFTLADGLPDLKIECLHEDQQGRLWIGTHDRGVCCYDGQRFTGYTRQHGLAGNSVYSILEDQQGVLWFGTHRGVTRYDGRTFEGLEASASYPFLWGSCQDAQGHLWFGLGRRRRQPPAVGRWDGRAFTLIPLGDQALPQGQSIHQVSVDVQQRLWCSGDGVYCYDLQQGQIHAIEPYPSSFHSQLIRADGRLWLTCWHGLFVLDESQLEKCTAAPPFHYGALAENDDSVNFWVTTYDGELLYGDGAAFQSIRQLNARLWHGLCLDRRGRLWIGSYGMGLYCYEYRRLKIFTPATGLPAARIRCLARSTDQDFWIGAANGLLFYDDAQSTFTPAPPFAGKEITALHQDRQQQLWVGVENEGLYVYDGGQARLVDNPADTSEYVAVSALCEDAEGGLWFGYGFGQGLGYYHRGRLQTFRAGESAGYPTWIGALEVDGPGRLWLGSCSQDDWQGLYLFDGRSCTPLPGVAEGAIRCLLKTRDGILWIGANEGLQRFDGKTLTTFTRQDGLPCDLITALLPARDGALWIGTEGGGVSLYDGLLFQSLQLPDEHSAGNVIHALHQQADGRGWWGTEDGLVQYTPQSTPPRIAVSAVLADQSYEAAAQVAFPTTVRRVAFQFHGASPVDFPEHLVYRYRLEGHESTWQRTVATQVDYPPLEPGTYRFAVQAVDRDLNYSPLAQVELTVTPDPQRQALHEALRTGLTAGPLIGASPAWQVVEQQLHQAAQTELTVLINGETGTGKSRVAQVIHDLSARRDQPFVYVDCASLDHALLNSTLFGHERGAFTGAQARRLGKFEVAHLGSIFLDEIGDLPLESQAHLLRVLQERRFERVGGHQPLTVDVRVIAATQRDLVQAVQQGAFRADLYYRLNEFLIVLPPLRQRQEDIPRLADYFVRQAAARWRRPPPRLSPAALAQLQTYSWPGNVRELEYTLRRAMTFAQDGVIEPAHLSEGPGHAIDRIVPLDDYLRAYLLQVLEHTHGVIYGERGAAALLGLHPNTLRHRLTRLGITFRRQDRPPEED